MLTKLSIRNFKRFLSVDIDLSPSVVFIGPNNSGKTTALQALALWDAGCKQWVAKRTQAGKKDAAKAVTIGRKDLVYLPLPASNALWRDLRVREGFREEDKTKTRNILIEIVVEGLDEHGDWACGFEFEYASEEFFYCRPLRLSDDDKPTRMPVPIEHVGLVKLAFLPPMSGLLMEEPLLQTGRVDVLLGSGRSGEVLRNLCYSVYEKDPARWLQIVTSMKSLFGITLRDPVFVSQLGTVDIDYLTRQGGPTLPLTSAGLGMQQSLLLLAYLHLNPRAILLLDEPDAHLEILRQRQIYQLLTDIARQNHAQIICASHSEVVLNEAVNRDTVVAFIGKPHVVSGNRGAQVLKALRDIGFEHYVQAEQTGWVLYLEGSTDLAILLAWAKLLKHPAASVLDKPYAHYLNTNIPSYAHNHYAAIREANPRLLGIALFDALDKDVQGEREGLRVLTWQRREIENYIAYPALLLRFAAGEPTDDLIEAYEAQQRVAAMQEAISDIETALQTLGEDLWSPQRKASEQVLPQVLSRYHLKNPDSRLPMAKGAYYTLIQYQLSTEVAPEVSVVLDSIYHVASNAQPYDNSESPR
jgi:predicted ATPase